MVTKFDAPKIDLNLQPVVIYCENQEMAWMQRDMLKSFDIGLVRCATRPGELEELATTFSLGAVVVNGRSEAEFMTAVRCVRDQSESQNPFAISLMVTPTVSEAVVKAAIRMGYDSLLCLPLSSARLWKTISSFASKDRQFVRVGEYFGPDRRDVKIAPKPKADNKGRRTEDLAVKAGLKKAG